ncbi:MAG: PAS domain S-box protein [Candidatus Micrarchaeia archaeon]
MANPITMKGREIPSPKYAAFQSRLEAATPFEKIFLKARHPIMSRKLWKQEQMDIAIQNAFAGRQNNLYKAMFEDTAMPMFLIDSNTGILQDANEAASRFYGYSREELRGMSITNINMLDKETIVNGMKTARAKQKTHFEYPHRLADGSIRRVQIFSSPIMEEAGKGLLLSIINDVTAKHDLEMKNTKIMQTAIDGFLEHDLKGTIINVNDEFCAKTGYSREELIGRSVLKIKANESKEDLRMRLAEIITNGKTYFESVHRKKDGSEFHVEVSASFTEEFGGRFFSFIRDITARKEMENMLKEAVDSKDRFFNIMAHDLRSPFQGLLGASNILKTDIDSLSRDEIRTIAGMLEQSANKTYNLLEELLTWSRLNSGRMQYCPENLPVSAIVDGKIALLDLVAADKGIKITSNVPAGLYAYFDENMTSQVVQNLLGNAIKFTNKGGSIEVSARDAGNGFVQITVEDNGVGIAEEDMPRIFKLGSSFTTEGTDGEPGTGLGLVLAKGMMEAQGGNIWVESQRGLGSSFHITLPEARLENTDGKAVEA